MFSIRILMILLLSKIAFAASPLYTSDEFSKALELAVGNGQNDRIQLGAGIFEASETSPFHFLDFQPTTLEIEGAPDGASELIIRGSKFFQVFSGNPGGKVILRNLVIFIEGTLENSISDFFQGRVEFHSCRLLVLGIPDSSIEVLKKEPFILEETDIVLKERGHNTVESASSANTLCAGDCQENPVWQLGKNYVVENPEYFSLVPYTQVNQIAEISFKLGKNEVLDNPSFYGVMGLNSAYNLSNLSFQEGYQKAMDSVEGGAISSIIAPDLVSLTRARIKELGDGWHMISSFADLNDMEIFSEVKVVWSQTSGEWRFYSPDTRVQSLLIGGGYKVLEEVKAGQSLWIRKGEGSTPIPGQDSIVSQSYGGFSGKLQFNEYENLFSYKDVVISIEGTDQVTHPDSQGYFHMQVPIFDPRQNEEDEFKIRVRFYHKSFHGQVINHFTINRGEVSHMDPPSMQPKTVTLVGDVVNPDTAVSATVLEIGREGGITGGEPDCENGTSGQYGISEIPIHVPLTVGIMTYACNGNTITRFHRVAQFTAVENGTSVFKAPPVDSDLSQEAIYFGFTQGKIQFDKFTHLFSPGDITVSIDGSNLSTHPDSNGYFKLPVPFFNAKQREKDEISIRLSFYHESFHPVYLNNQLVHRGQVSTVVPPAMQPKTVKIVGDVINPETSTNAIIANSGLNSGVTGGRALCPQGTSGAYSIDGVPVGVSQTVQMNTYVCLEDHTQIIRREVTFTPVDNGTGVFHVSAIDGSPDNDLLYFGTIQGQIQFYRFASLFSYEDITVQLMNTELAVKPDSRGNFRIRIPLENVEDPFIDQKSFRVRFTHPNFHEFIVKNILVLRGKIAEIEPPAMQPRTVTIVGDVTNPDTSQNAVIAETGKEGGITGGAALCPQGTRGQYSIDGVPLGIPMHVVVANYHCDKGGVNPPTITRNQIEFTPVENGTGVFRVPVIAP